MKKYLDTLEEKGLLFDTFGLLKPNSKDNTSIEKKIISDLVELKKAIDTFRNEGKHILYLPGSYDMVHVGHAFFIDHAITSYLAQPEHKDLKRTDIIVLVLADDDQLISRVKNERPMQSETIFRSLRSKGNWRLIELASIPYVDIVGFIPSPVGLQKIAPVEIPVEIIGPQKTFTDLKKHLDRFKETQKISKEDSDTLEEALTDYDALVKALSENHLTIAAAFEKDATTLSVQAWQLFIHVYLGHGSFTAPFVRVVSHNDVKYKDQVSFLMDVSGLHVMYVQDELLLSTTSLLDVHGLDTLIAAKKVHYEDYDEPEEKETEEDLAML